MSAKLTVPGRPRNRVAPSGQRLAAAFCAIFVFLTATCVARCQAGNYWDIQIPQGSAVAFPTPESKLNQMRDLQDVPGIRAHAWALLSGLVSPVNVGGEKRAVWETWYYRDSDVIRGCKHQGQQIVREFEIPLEIVAGFAANAGKNVHSPEFSDSQKKAEAFFESANSPRSGILLNRAACKHLFSLGLQTPAEAEKILNDQNSHLDHIEAPAAERDVAQFPNGAIVVKAVWMRVPKNGNGSFRYWRPDYGPDSVVVNPALGKPCDLKAQAILTSCFYNVPVTNDNYGELSSAGYGWGDLQLGDVIVLAGLHVITKEVADWTWATFWWSPVPNDPNGADRPGIRFIPAEWQNYVMSATLSMITSYEKDRQRTCCTGVIPNPDLPAVKQCVAEPACKPDALAVQDSDRAKIIFNPYLEGWFSPMTQSNCMNCHKQAAFPRFQPDPSILPQRGYLGSDATCFMSRIRLDYLWSITPPAPNSLLFVFDTALQNALQTKTQSR